MAQRVEDPADKARTLDMAETFRELADKYEAKNAAAKNRSFGAGPLYSPLSPIIF